MQKPKTVKKEVSKEVRAIRWGGKKRLRELRKRKKSANWEMEYQHGTKDVQELRNEK